MKTGFITNWDVSDAVSFLTIFSQLTRSREMCNSKKVWGVYSVTVNASMNEWKSGDKWKITPFSTITITTIVIFNVASTASDIASTLLHFLPGSAFIGYITFVPAQRVEDVVFVEVVSVVDHVFRLIFNCATLASGEAGKLSFIIILKSIKIFPFCQTFTKIISWKNNNFRADLKIVATYENSLINRIKLTTILHH